MSSPVLPRLARISTGKRARGSFEIRASLGKTGEDRKSTRLNSSHTVISYAVFCLKKKKKKQQKRKENQTSPRVVRGADNHPRGDDDVCANPADAPVAWTVLAINQRRNPAARQCHR